jgi:hypothetical protein
MDLSYNTELSNDAIGLHHDMDPADAELSSANGLSAGYVTDSGANILGFRSDYAYTGTDGKEHVLSLFIDGLRFVQYGTAGALPKVDESTFWFAGASPRGAASNFSAWTGNAEIRMDLPLVSDEYIDPYNPFNKEDGTHPLIYAKQDEKGYLLLSQPLPGDTTMVKNGHNGSPTLVDPDGTPNTGDEYPAVLVDPDGTPNTGDEYYDHSELLTTHHDPDGTPNTGDEYQTYSYRNYTTTTTSQPEGYLPIDKVYVRTVLAGPSVGTKVKKDKLWFSDFGYWVKSAHTVTGLSSKNDSFNIITIEPFVGGFGNYRQNAIARQYLANSGTQTLTFTGKAAGGAVHYDSVQRVNDTYNYGACTSCTTDDRFYNAVGYNNTQGVPLVKELYGSAVFTLAQGGAGRYEQLDVAFKDEQGKDWYSLTLKNSYSANTDLPPTLVVGTPTALGSSDLWFDGWTSAGTTKAASMTSYYYGGYFDKHADRTNPFNLLQEVNGTIGIAYHAADNSATFLNAAYGARR